MSYFSKKMIILLTFISFQMACSTMFRGRGADETIKSESIFKEHNSQQKNSDRSPQSLNMPQMASGSKGEENPVIDSFYMQSQADYHYSMGEAFSYEGQPQKAIEEFKTARIYDAKSSQLPMRLAVEYLKMGLVTEAQDQAEVAIEKDPKSLMARLFLGGLYTTLRQYKQGLEQYQKVLELDPQNSEAPLYIGAIYAEQKDYEKSIKYFESLANNKKFPNLYLAYYYVGKIRLSQEGKAYEIAAEKALKKSIELKPDYEESTLSLASLYTKIGRTEKVLNLFKIFQSEYGPNLKMAEILAQTYLEQENYILAYEQLEILDGLSADSLNIKLKMALILIEQKKYPLAIIKLKEILRQVPEGDKIRFYLAAVYEETKNDKEAIEHFRKIEAQSEYYSDSVIHSVFLLQKNKQIDEALELAKDALKKRDDLPQFYGLYASLLDDKGQIQAAVDVLKKGIEKFPKNVQLQFYSGTLQDRLGNKEASLDQMNKVIELDPKHVQGLNYLAYTYAEMGEKLEEAKSLASRALNLEPKDAYIMDTYGWVLFHLGQFEESIKILETAFKNQPKESIIAEHLGDAYFKKNLVNKAKKMYEKAVEVESDKKRIQFLREKISGIDNPEVRPELLRLPAANRISDAVTPVETGTKSKP